MCERTAVLSTPDGRGVLELFEYIHPPASPMRPTQPNDLGMHRVAFQVEDLDAALEKAAAHGCHPLRGVADYQGVCRLTYLRGPSGIVVMLAQDMRGD
jgi:glyoxylase I family protein